MLSRMIELVEPAQFFGVRGLITERGQATARLCWTATLAVFLIVTFPRFGHYPEYPVALAMLAVQGIFAILFLYLVVKKIADGSSRLVCSVAFDQVCLGTMLFLTGEITAPFVLVTLLQTFGSGLRYGRKYALLSSAIGSLSVVLLIAYSRYWMQHADLASGIAAAVIFIPFYVFRLSDELAFSTRIDGMTKLWNRLAFDESLNALCLGTTKLSTSGAVVLLDLDGFKTINDKQGHPTGDKVLQWAAYALSAELSSFGTVARIGGDEFGVVVNELKSADALEAALRRFLARAVEAGGDFGSPLSASIGVYYFNAGTAPTRNFLYKAADSLMYLSKVMGKGQFQTSTGRTFSKEGAVIMDSDFSTAPA